jgi:Transcriptional activator of glycolytic enzymes
MDASGDSQIRKLNELLRLVSQGLKFEPLRAHWAAFEAPDAQPYAQPSDPPAGVRPQEPQDAASASPRAPVYQLFAARTVADAWREWTDGIAGAPAVRDLESTWGHRWRPEPKTQVAWNRRKEILDEVQRLIDRGHSEEAAVAELERRRGGGSLRKLVDELKARRKGSGMV